MDMNISMTKRRIVVFTGNSNSGSACVEELYAKFADRVAVRAIFRSEEKAEPYRQRYPTLEVFANVDASMPDTLNNVFSGCDVAVLVTPHDPNRGMNDDAKLTETMIMKAVDSGDVKYIVYVGSFTCNFPDTIPIISSRFIPSESLLAKLGQERGLKWTSLRGGYFMENTIYSCQQTIRSQNKVFFIKDGKYPMIDTKYIGKLAAACAVADNIDVHHGKYYECSGPEILSPADIADVFTRVLGRKIDWVETPQASIDKMPEYYKQIIAHMKLYGDKAVPFSNDIKKLVGENGTFEEFVQRHIKDFQ